METINTNTVPAVNAAPAYDASINDAVVAAVKEYIFNFNRPCPSDYLIDTFGTKVKKNIEALKESSALVGLRGRPPVGGLILPEMVGQIGITRAVKAAEKRATKAQERADKAAAKAQEKATKAAERAEKAAEKARIEQDKAAAKIAAAAPKTADAVAASEIDRVFDLMAAAGEEIPSVEIPSFDAEIDEIQTETVPF